MYIEQVKNKKFTIWSYLLYLPIPVSFIFLMLLNFILTKGVDTEKMMHDMIDQFGVNFTFVLMVAPLSFACLFLLFYVKFVHGQSLTSLTTSRKKVDWKRIFFSFGLWTTITTVLILLAYWASPENYVYNFKPAPFFTFLFLGMILIPLQTSFEEYLFRGYMMQGIGVATNSRLIPLLVTSIIFGLMHAANPEVEKIGPMIMIYYIGTGFFLGIMTLMDEGLELSLGFHAANNLTGALLMTADWTAFQTHSIFKDVSEPSAGFDILLPVFVIFPILLFIFAKKYNWTNWKQKLTGKLIFEEKNV